MEFASKQLRRSVEEQRQLRKKYGKMEESVKRRIQALRVAKTVGHLKLIDPRGRWHSLTGNFKDCWSGSTSVNHRIIIQLNRDTPDQPDDLVTSVVVLDCKRDYHGR